ncbi:MAG: O-antigen ligase family protein [Patescibacteria group bacterium]|nr:O-antigen ligase family protein [Patescibacteria group bacterium]
MKAFSFTNILFYLILFLIPANLAKHFILPSSYVSGILVDYLVPAVYLTDVLIILLLIIKPIKKIPKTLMIFWLLLLPSVIFSSSLIPAIYKFGKIIEFSLFGLWIYHHRLTLSPTIVVKSVNLTVLFQSLLAIGQWLKQSSIFGYWFLGEQPYNAATAGIDKIIWLNGALKIPPLGTFSHPNVLAGFLVIGLTLIFYKGFSFVKKTEPYWITFFLGLIALFLTFSLSAWLAFLLLTLPFSLRGRTSQAFLIYFSSLLIILSLFSRGFSYLAPESSFSRRSQLNKIAWQMFLNHPLTGVGLNNFTLTMDQYGYIPATTRFLQPVHNIYLLILSETGLIGFTGFLYLIFFIFKKISNSIFHSSFLVLIFLGLFDHYLITLQQGLLLFFICLPFYQTKNSYPR